MLLDTMATRYHMLPSQALEQADTFDLYILNKALAIRSGAKNGVKPVPQLTQEEMIKMVNAVKEKENGKRI